MNLESLHLNSSLPTIWSNLLTCNYKWKMGRTEAIAIISIYEESRRQKLDLISRPLLLLFWTKFWVKNPQKTWNWTESSDFWPSQLSGCPPMRCVMSSILLHGKTRNYAPCLGYGRSELWWCSESAPPWFFQKHPYMQETPETTTRSALWHHISLGLPPTCFNPQGQQDLHTPSSSPTSCSFWVLKHCIYPSSEQVDFSAWGWSPLDFLSFA